MKHCGSLSNIKNCQLQKLPKYLIIIHCECHLVFLVVLTVVDWVFMYYVCVQINVSNSFSTAKSSPGSPEPDNLDVDVDHKTKRAIISNTVTTILTPLEKTSPCASNESLTVDHSR